MAFLGVRDALLARLTGQAGMGVGEQLTGGRGAGMHAPTRATSNVGVPSNGFREAGRLIVPSAPGDMSEGVPVIPYDIAGRGYSELPVLSVYMNRPPVARRDASTAPPNTVIYEDVVASRLTATFDDGTTMEGPGLVKTRPYGQPFNYEFAIRIWAKNEGEAMLIFERLYAILEDRGFLYVTMRDGTEVSYDTFMDPQPAVIAVPEGLLEEGDAGEYSLLTIYTVEGYADTTDRKTVERTIREATLLVTDLDDTAQTTITEPEEVTPA